MTEDRKYDTVIFDLDGTLLNTLEDLSDSVNHALAKWNMPPRSLEEIRRFVGNGVLRLMELSVPEGRENPRFDQIYGDFKAYYSLHCNDKTCPYPGIAELLVQLRQAGCRMAIVSNKYQDAVEELRKRYFDGILGTAIGESEGVRKKPAPDMVYQALDALGSKKENAVYVGDSEVDLATAAHAGMDCVLVGWGFRTREEQERAGGKRFVSDPLELLRLI